MKYIIFLIAIILSFAISANAALVDNGDGTVTQIRNDGSVLMWLKDANTAKTSGYDADGLMTWDQANTWIGTLNSSNYLGYNDWRLPDTNPVDGSSFDYNWDHDYYGSTDRGYNISAPGSAYPGSTGSDMAYMFYTELGNLGYYDTSGNWPQAGWGLTNSGPFDNIQSYFYWSDSYYTPDSGVAWFFHFDLGVQNGNDIVYNYNAWAMRVVPEPITIEIDIKPDGNPNSINLRSRSDIPVAILTTEDFDATTVDPLSIWFGPEGAVEAHEKGHIEDADGDGDLDLVLHFRIQETGIACEDIEAGLTGVTFDEQEIEGYDFVNIVKCN
jgi:hypothetical protein